MNTKRWMIALLVVTLAAGCSRSKKEGDEKEQVRESNLTIEENASAKEKNRSANPVVAMINGREVRASDLRSQLFETAGGDLMHEYALDMQIEKELAARQLNVTDAAIEAERELMLSRFSDDPDRSRRILDEMRSRLGLGPKRFTGLLWRNAALRLLVTEKIEVSDEMVKSAHAQQVSELSQCRLILVPTLREAQHVVNLLNDGMDFVQAAIKHSSDSSRDQGGRLPPIASWDTSFPPEIRTIATQLQPGERSDPIMLEEGFAILLCEKKIEPQVKPFEEVKQQLRAELQLGLEGIEMDRMARSLLDGAEILFLDADLRDAFQRRSAQLNRSE